jgi:hypothetical protein
VVWCGEVGGGEVEVALRCGAARTALVLMCCVPRLLLTEEVRHGVISWGHSPKDTCNARLHACDATQQSLRMRACCVVTCSAPSANGLVRWVIHPPTEPERARA